jgi:hypothetical protein
MLSEMEHCCWLQKRRPSAEETAGTVPVCFELALLCVYLPAVSVESTGLRNSWLISAAAAARRASRSKCDLPVPESRIR